MRRGLLYTERNARKVRIFAKGNVGDVWNQASSFYYGKRVANVFVRVRKWRTSIRSSSVGGVWLQGIKMLQVRVWQSRELASRASR